MDSGPKFDASDQFDPRRLRLIDIDGSGVRRFGISTCQARSLSE
jgi:hypothetical protein